VNGGAGGFYLEAVRHQLLVSALKRSTARGIRVDWVDRRRARGWGDRLWRNVPLRVYGFSIFIKNTQPMLLGNLHW